MATHEYWRIYLPDSSYSISTSGYHQVGAEWDWLESGDVSVKSDIISTLTSGDEGSYTVSLLHDGNTSNFHQWSGSTFPKYAGVRFGTARDIVKLKIRSNATYWSRCPSGFLVQYSDNGTDWTTAWTDPAGTIHWTGSQEKTFPQDPKIFVPQVHAQTEYKEASTVRVPHVHAQTEYKEASPTIRVSHVHAQTEYQEIEYQEISCDQGDTLQATFDKTGASWVYSATVYPNFRIVIPASAITKSGEKLRICIKAHNTTDLTIRSGSIGERSGSTDDFVTAPVRITWDDGEWGTTVSSGVDKWSDLIAFDLDESKSYLIHLYMTASNSFAYILNGHEGYYGGTVEDTDELSVAYNSGLNHYCVSKIEVCAESQTGGGLFFCHG